jgi:hypothetical protein
MKGYKLTRADGTTTGGGNVCQWWPGVRHEAKGPATGPLCSSSWIHFYESPLLAVLHNPIHADYRDPILWEIETDGAVKSEGHMKSGARGVTTTCRIPLPQIETKHKIAYAILCALEVFDAPAFRTWAENWLSGADRTDKAEAAEAAAWAAWAAAARKPLDLIAIAQKALEIV